MLGQQIVFLKVMVGDVGMITPPSSSPPPLPQVGAETRHKRAVVIEPIWDAAVNCDQIICQGY